MKDNLPAVVAFLTDLERLKLVNRKAYVSDLSRRENSAERTLATGGRGPKRLIARADDNRDVIICGDLGRRRPGAGSYDAEMLAPGWSFVHRLFPK
jgi:hypothetical protein